MKKEPAKSWDFNTLTAVHEMLRFLPLKCTGHGHEVNIHVVLRNIIKMTKV